MSSEVLGVIVPHPPIFVPSVGGEERHRADASLRALAAASQAIAAFAPETLVVMSPHAPAVFDTFLVDTAPLMEGSLGEFGSPDAFSWPVDTELAEALVRNIDAADIPVAPRSADPRLRSGWLDHATIVPLSFLDPERRYRIVVLSLSYLALTTHRKLGRVVRETVEALGRRAVFVASGDCSHRLSRSAPAGFSPRGEEFDHLLGDIVRSGRLSELADIDSELSEAAGECGLRSFVTLGGYMGDDPVPTRLLAYEGPWGVGYLTAVVGEDAGVACDVPRAAEEAEVATEAESEIVALARGTLRARLLGGTPPAAVLASSEYPARAGAFVSLHRGGGLRGCIGTIAPTQPTLAEEVAHNVLEAALNDPRFDAMTADELDDLEISVDVLHPAEPATLEQLDPKRFGVIVTAGYRRGLLLPDLEGVDDIATQLDIALRKAGISPDEQFSIERFRVDRFH